MSVREGCLGVVMLPLCLYMAYTTSVEQTTKRKATNLLLPSVQEMFPPAKPAYHALLRDPTREEKKKS